LEDKCTHIPVSITYGASQKPVLRIRGVYLFSIPDPGSELSPSRIPDPHQRILSILTPKKWYLSSRKYDPDCSSQIPDPDADFLPIPDPGVKKAPDPGSGSATLKKTHPI